VVELWDTDRMGPGNASRVTPVAGWQQGALLASWSAQPAGNVRSSLQFNVTPADVLTDIRGACLPAAHGPRLSARAAWRAPFRAKPC